MYFFFYSNRRRTCCVLVLYHSYLVMQKGGLTYLSQEKPDMLYVNIIDSPLCCRMAVWCTSILIESKHALCKYFYCGYLVLQKDGLRYLSQEKPDVLCVQETKCSEVKLPAEVNVEGYKAYWVSAETEGYAGVGMYTKADPISIKYGIGNIFSL